MTTTPPAPPVKFLLVDDLEENLLVLEALLRRPDLELLQARSGDQALELLLNHDVALALVDVQMPGMDGFELAELMRSVERTRHVPIIFVTAGAREQRRIFQGYDAGAVDFLFKPIDPTILQHKAETFFQLYRQRQQLAEQLELLRASEELRARMLESSLDAILVIDVHGRVVSANENASLSLGAGSEERVLTSTWAGLWSAEHAADAEASLAGALSGKAGRILARAEHATLPDSWWDVAVTPIRGPSGATDKVLAVARDVSEQRRDELTRERLMADLRETLRLNETFVAAMSHDLRSPLTAIVTGAEMLTLRNTDPRVGKIAERLRSSGRRMTHMINDLNDLARARLGGGIAIDRQELDLLSIAQRVIAEQEVTAPERRFDLTHEGDLQGDWDEGRVEQVLANLIGNAVHHGAPSEPVSVRLMGREEAVEIAIHNGGCVPKEIMPHLFDPFRSSREGTARKEGLGLGLYIVKQIVNAHEGEVAVCSSEEQGTTFNVHLPRQASKSSAPASVASASMR